jgi:transcription initiation factor TFIIF subunit beta
MEMASTDSGNLPKSYSLNMFKDFVPMSVFSETNQGEDLNSGSLKYLSKKILVL